MTFEHRFRGGPGSPNDRMEELAEELVEVIPPGKLTNSSPKKTHYFSRKIQNEPTPTIDFQGDIRSFSGEYPLLP